MKKIIFYPITCNPPHLGHVSAVKFAIKHIHFDEVWIMPGGKRVDKEISVSYEDIKNMCNLFIEYLRTEVNVPVKVITSAIDNTDSVYTHEAILELKSQTKDELFQLCGIDGFLSIKERVIGPDENFVIIKRSGYFIPKDLLTKNNLTIFDEEVKDISSTQIREMIRVGNEEYRKFVPEIIATYIKDETLYV